MERLIRSGFLYNYLLAQARMHRLIFAPANDFYYDSKITSNPDGDFSLRPGWLEFMPKAGGYPEGSTLSPDQERMLWIEVIGDNTRRAPTGPKGNYATFHHTMQLIKGPRRAMFGAETNSEVDMLTPYSRQRLMYSTAFMELVRIHGWTEDELPRLLTVDSAVSRECKYSIIDLTIDNMSYKVRDAWLMLGGSVST